MLSLRSLRRRTHFILEVDRFGSRTSRWVDKSLVVLIVLNVLVAILQTDARVHTRAPWAFDLFETVSLSIFGLEYVLRIWSAVENPEYERPVAGRLRFALQPMMLLDLFVLVIPAMAGLLKASIDVRPLRILRLLRLGRYSPKLRLFAGVLRDKRDELFVGLFVAIVLLIACSTGMYWVEGDTRDGFRSIPETMWWGVATLTTVGYGDVYPETGLGKVLGSLVALLGVGVFALPAGILASGFSDALSREGQLRDSEEESESGTEPQGDGLQAVSGASTDEFGHATGAMDASGTCPHCGAST